MVRQVVVAWRRNDNSLPRRTGASGCDPLSQALPCRSVAERLQPLRLDGKVLYLCNVCRLCASNFLSSTKSVC